MPAGAVRLVLPNGYDYKFQYRVCAIDSYINVISGRYNPTQTNKIFFGSHFAFRLLSVIS